MNGATSDRNGACDGEKSSLAEIFFIFLKLGLTSFGGPTAHLGYFREAFVGRRRWMTDAEYADLVALCQFLPGPASSQVGYAVGLQRGGFAGGMAAWLGFTLPSAVALAIFGLTLTWTGQQSEAGWLAGLQLAAVVVIAKAVQSMAVSLCPDKKRATLALVATMAVLAWPGTLAQLGVIVGGGLFGWLFLKGTEVAEEKVQVTAPPAKSSMLAPVVCLGLLALLLIGLPALAARFDNDLLAVADSFFRTGSLVFGGGHVVLPMLRAEMVDTGLVTESAFLAGYGAAQAVPGPLFTFSAYLGAVVKSNYSPLLLSSVALVAIFVPSWLLVAGVLPFWEKVRRVTVLRRALAGTNAAVVGLLAAALYQPAWTGAVAGIEDVIFLLGVAALLLVWKLPPWLVVIVAGIAGSIFLR